MKIEHVQVSAWLKRYRGIDITPQAVGQYRRGKTGSEYAGQIAEAEIALAAEALTLHLQGRAKRSTVSS